jgi:hypothetical protein
MAPFVTYILLVSFLVTRTIADVLALHRGSGDRRDLAP